MLQRARPENKHKRYVSVIVFYPRGLDQSHAKVLRIQFGNGDVWTVDETRRGFWAAAQKAGGAGMLYPIWATAKPEDGSAPGPRHEMKLFCDDGDWFVELDEPGE